MVNTPRNLAWDSRNERGLDFRISSLDGGLRSTDPERLSKSSSGTDKRKNGNPRESCRGSNAGSRRCIERERQRNRHVEGFGFAMHFQHATKSLAKIWRKITAYVAPKAYDKEADPVYQMMRANRSRSLQQARASHREVRELRMNRVEETWLNRPRRSK
jgi:hypothetical protein